MHGVIDRSDVAQKMLNRPCAL